MTYFHLSLENSKALLRCGLQGGGKKKQSEGVLAEQARVLLKSHGSLQEVRQGEERLPRLSELRSREEGNSKIERERSCAESERRDL